MSEFNEFGVLPEIIQSIEELGWTLPTPIQTEAIPMILGGGDVLAAAETGSGKTGAFAIPIVQIVFEELRDILQGKASRVSRPKSTPAGKSMIELNPSDRDPGFQIEQEGDGLIATSFTNNWAGCRANTSILGGVHCFEVCVTNLTDNGIVRVGFSTSSAKLDLGTDEYGFGFGGTGKKSNRREFLAYGQPFGVGDSILCCYDSINRMIWFEKNGTDLGDAFHIPEQIARFGLFPAFCIKNARIETNFGSSPCKFPSRRNNDCVPMINNDPNCSGHIIQRINETTTEEKGPLCVVLEPSRELAEQTHKAFETFSKHLQHPSVKMALLVGGLSVGPQQFLIRSGVDIVTATPGRLEAFISDGTLKLSNVRFFVLDEADSLAETCLSTVKTVWDRVPKSRLQVLMLSATLQSDTVKALAESICRFPTWIDLKGKDIIPNTVDHSFYLIDPMKRINASNIRIQTDGVHLKKDPECERLSEEIKLQKAQVLLKVIEANKMSQCIIFCRTKIDCDHLEQFLNNVGTSGKQRGGIGILENELSCAVIHGDKFQQERQANLEKFKSGEVRFLVTTDVAARGIDISEVPFVINYTLPDSAEDYIHRVGRVGRAERTGLAISFIGIAPERVWYHKCPSRGKNCQNRLLIDEGGCTMWYNEMEIWKSIQTRLEKVSFIQLDQNFKDSHLSNPLSLQQYGQKRGEKNDVLTHATELKEKVTELARLENQIQLNFWNLKSQFSNLH